MRLKIISDGTPGSTYVIDADTGDRLIGVSRVSRSIGADDAFAKVALEYFVYPPGLAAEMERAIVPRTITPKFRQPEGSNKTQS
jgi:hypothetical protein